MKDQLRQSIIGGNEDVATAMTQTLVATGASAREIVDEVLLAAELLHSFGIPALGPFGGTDAEQPSTWLGGVETMLQLLRLPLDGCELCTGIGLTNTYQLFTPENLVLDDDLYHCARHAFLDIPMDDESLALDVIEAVGPGGHFLAQPHTRRHMQEVVVRAVSCARSSRRLTGGS